MAKPRNYEFFGEDGLRAVIRLAAGFEEVLKKPRDREKRRVWTRKREAAEAELARRGLK